MTFWDFADRHIIGAIVLCGIGGMSAFFVGLVTVDIVNAWRRRR